MSTAQLKEVEDILVRLSGVTYVARKTNKTRYVIASIAGILFLILAALIIISAYNGWQLLHPQKKDLEAFSSNIVPEYTNVAFSTTDKSVQLSGWYFKTKSSDRTIIFVHSYGSNRMQFGKETIVLIKELLTKGYNVLTFDLRNSGRSGGNISTLGYTEKEDIAAAIKWSKAQGSSHMILFGFSTGASASLLAADESKDVDAVIADSPYSNLNDYLDDNLNKWTSLPAFPFNKTILFSIELLSGIDTKKASPIDTLKKGIQYKLLLIHGKNNKLVNIENSYELLKAAGSSATLWETNSSNSISSYTDMPTEYTDKVMGFLDAIYSK